MAWRGEQAAVYARAGNQAAGYYQGGGLLYGGSGSGMGPSMAGTGTLPAGQGVSVGNQTWHPTVLYLVALIVAEMVVFGFIGHLLGK